ncbi:glycine betaine/proline transport system substrate-binding protein [Secundilactobacillus oryzae JCM 18671]|uniref:Glycine betaine/proline transport system substrate-binding protein n=1 Tax=Secundilactobacillus oryzae JCM 18671 TaxID=1291743 RepID=A0A081BJ77_9LACO|nr:glycine betaine ABC transporter substrate-binding protein [Secundilactobacillus oryzae]GAK48095.1 glycine betaine/proline transport system substrate-binding protein [Secundilactobacillus oryzae JCM 18671]
MKFKRLLLLAFITVMVIPLTACQSSTAAYDSSKKLGPQINYTITGIDAGAGIMGGTQKALSAYHLTQGKWQLQTSSTAAMTSTLNKAIKYKQPIVITGWQPHWMFTKYPIKFLKDPKNVFGKAESIHSIARVGLKKDNPGVYRFLQQFHWNATQMSKIMLKVNNGVKPATAAKTYIKDNPKQVAQWLKGVPNGHGKSVKFTYVAWDSEIASTNLVKQLLEMKGYKVTIQPMEAQTMWASVATNAADASVSAWLPTTSGRYAKQYKGRFVDVRANLHGAKTGLAVPKYMKNINSISDLLTK